MVDQNTAKALSEEKGKLIASGSLHWFHWVIILSSFILTITAWQIALRANAQSVQTRFDREASQVVSHITERMEKYEQALWSGVAAFSASDEAFTADRWQVYSNSLNLESKYPGINGIGVIDYVPRRELDAYLAAQRQTRPDFKIFPEHAQDELWPITYIEPVETNAAAIGLDMAHEVNRYNAALSARSSGTAQITGPIVLVQDEKHTPGFLFFAPSYRSAVTDTEEARIQNFERLVYAPFIFEKLLRGALETDQRLVSIKVTDNGAVLYDELTSETRKVTSNTYSSKVNVEMYGRQWTFDIRSNAAFAMATNNKKPWIVLVMGLMIEAMIIVFFVGLARANRNAIALAGKMAQAHQEKANQLENVMYNSIDGIMLSDEKGNIISANRAAEELFGYSSKALLKLNFTSLFPEFENIFKHAVLADKIISETLPGRNQPAEIIELIGTRKDGTKLELEITMSKIIDQGHTLFNLIVRDISERKKTEARLKDTMNDLIQSNEDLEKFAYIASHDLKSPLRAIDKLSQWIYEDMGHLADEENAKRFEMIKGRIARLQSLLTSLLMYSRAGHTFEQKEFGPASDLLKDVVKVQNVPSDFHIELSGPLDDMIISRMPLGQVFTNLLDNAVKHHPGDNGRIEISGTITDTSYVFRFADNGPGIDPAMHGKIFEMFQTLRRRDEVEGAGMGLALVKKMLLRHGGRVSIESEEGKGASFIVTWPKQAVDIHKFQEAV